MCSLIRIKQLASIVCLIVGLISTQARGTDAVNLPSTDGPMSELHLGRLVFQNSANSSWGPGRPWWRIDWPEAEFHFINGVRRYTVIDVADDSVHLSLLDDAIFDYPWLFVQQVGRWRFSDDELLRLREYLLRGGFMVVDDFHGPQQWQVFASVMDRVLPGHVVSPIDPSDELMHSHYDLKPDTQIPGRRHISGIRSDGTAIVNMPHSPATWRGIYDETGRLRVAINFNMDMGDAWEHANDPMYPLPMTSLSYQFGINYLVYAMTH